MRRARVCGGRVTVEAEAEVDVADVLKEAGTRYLLEELRSRAKGGDEDAFEYLNLENMRGRDRDALAYAVRHGKAQEALAILTANLFPYQPVPGGLPFECLPRDPQTRRPII